MRLIWLSLRQRVTQFYRRTLGILQIAGILILVAGAVIYAQAPTETEALAQSSMTTVKQRQTDSPLVSLVKPISSENTLKFNATGSVVVRNSITLVPQISGRVIWVAEGFKPGGYFTAGETVLRIDPEDFALALKQAQAQKDIAQSALELAQAQSDAAIANYALVRPGVEVPALVAKLPQVDQAKAQLAAAIANENVVRLNLNRTEFSLPFSGRVVASDAEIGQLLNQGQPFGSVFANDAVEAMVPLSATQLEGLKPAVGRQALVKTDRQQYRAIISRVAPVVDERTRFAQIYLDLEQAAALSPGTFLNVEIIGPTLDNTYLLPKATEQINQSVWTVVQGKLNRIQPDFLNRNTQGIVTNAFASGSGVVLGTVPGGYEGMQVRVEGNP